MSYVDLSGMAAQAKQASYVAGPDRDPIGLPLTEIWLGVFVEPVRLRQG